MKLTQKRKDELARAIVTIQDLLGAAYLHDEESAVIIKPEEVDIIGSGSEVVETGCTPERAIERLSEEQP